MSRRAENSQKVRTARTGGQRSCFNPWRLASHPTISPSPSISPIDAFCRRTCSMWTIPSWLAFRSISRCESCCCKLMDIFLQLVLPSNCSPQTATTRYDFQPGPYVARQPTHTSRRSTAEGDVRDAGDLRCQAAMIGWRQPDLQLFAVAGCYSIGGEAASIQGGNSGRLSDQRMSLPPKFVLR